MFLQLRNPHFCLLNKGREGFGLLWNLGAVQEQTPPGSLWHACPGVQVTTTGKEVEETPWLFSFIYSPAVGSFPCSTSKHAYNVNKTIVIIVIIIKTLKNHAVFLGWKDSNTSCPFLRRLLSLTPQVAMGVLHYPLKWWWAFLLLGKSWECEDSKEHSDDNAIMRTPLFGVLGVLSASKRFFFSY